MNKSFDTCRLVLKKFEDINLHDYYTILQDNSSLIVDFDKAYENFIELEHSDNYFAICLKATTHAIGYIYVEEVSKGKYEVGYLMNAAYENCGYASEALTAIASELTSENNYLVGIVDKKNIKPFKLLENCKKFSTLNFFKIIAYSKD